MGFVKIPYTNDAFKTFERLTKGINWQYNILYKKLNANNSPLYFYINTKNYLHFLKMRKWSKDGDIYIEDMRLTNANIFVDSNRTFGIHNNVAEALVYLDSLVGKGV